MGPAHFILIPAKKNVKKLLFFKPKKNKKLKTLIFNKKINSSPKYLIPAHFFLNSSPLFFNFSPKSVEKYIFLSKKKDLKRLIFNKKINSSPFFFLIPAH